MDKAQIIEALKLGRAKVEAGWTQGEYGTAETGYGYNTSLERYLAGATCVCAVGGLVYGVEVVCRNPEIGATDAAMPFEAVYALYAALPSDRPEVHYTSAEWTLDHNQFEVDAIAVWNDASSRTKEDVLALYDRAIAQEAST